MEDIRFRGSTGNLGWAGILLVGIMAAIPWLPGAFIVQEFIWDDVYLIERNPALATPEILPEAWGRPWAYSTEVEADQFRNQGYYRPLTTMSLYLDRAVWGLWPGGYRLSSAMWHGLTTAILLCLLLAVGLSYLGASLLCLLWAWHPVQGEVLHMAAYRTTQLDVLFSLLSLLLLVLVKERKLGRWAIILAVLAFAAGLFSKESGAMSLVAVPMAALAFGPARWRKEGFFLLGGTVVALLWWLVRRDIVTSPEAEVLGVLGLMDRLLLMLKVPVEYVGLLLWPVRLNPHYDVSLFFPPMVDGRTLLGLLLLAADATVLAMGMLRRRLWVWPLVAFHIAAFTYTGIIPLQMMMADRFVVLPLAFLVLAVGRRLSMTHPEHAQPDMVQRRKTVVWAARAVAVSLLLVLGVLSVARGSDWRDNRTLAESRIRDYPASFDAHFSLARLCLAEDDVSCAGHHLDAALSIYPEFPPAVEMKAQLGVPRGGE